MSESLWFFYQISISNYMTAFLVSVSLILRSLQKFFTSQKFFNIGFCVKYLNARFCFNESFLNCLLDFCFIVVACHSTPLMIYDWRSIPPPHMLQNFGTQETSTARQRMMRNSGGKCSKPDPPPLKGVGVHGLFITFIKTIKR